MKLDRTMMEKMMFKVSRNFLFKKNRTLSHAEFNEYFICMSF